MMIRWSRELLTLPRCFAVARSRIDCLLDTQNSMSCISFSSTFRRWDIRISILWISLLIKPISPSSLFSAFNLLLVSIANCNYLSGKKINGTQLAVRRFININHSTAVNIVTKWENKPFSPTWDFLFELLSALLPKELVPLLIGSVDCWDW